MLIDPHTLHENLPRLEEIEKASLRLVVQAVLDFRVAATDIFLRETDLAQDIGEDLTREALDRLGMSRTGDRLFGKIDYKKARYLFHPDYAVKQALFVDSKAEKTGGQANARLQTSQLSLEIRQIRQNERVIVPGRLPTILAIGDDNYLTTTIFVKYSYASVEGINQLRKIIVAALPNGVLQDVYNPTCEDTIFVTGPDSPLRGEAFRTRLNFQLLKNKRNWRVQNIPLAPAEFAWDE